MMFYLKRYLEEDNKSAWESIVVEFEDAEEYHALHDRFLGDGWLDSTEDEFEDPRATHVDAKTPRKKREKKVVELKEEEEV